MKKWLWFVIWFVVVMSLFLRWYQNMSSHFVWKEPVIVVDEKDLGLSQFLAYYQSGSFEKITLIDDEKLVGYQYLGTGETNTLWGLQKWADRARYLVYNASKPVSSSLQDLGISLTGEVLVDAEYEVQTVLQKLFETVGPVLLLFVLFIILVRFVMPKGGGLPFPMKVGKQSNKNIVKTKFSDVAGMEEVKMELMEIVDYLKDPEKYTKVGARHPKWVLLYGQPWSGKTLLARAVAGESNVPFFSASGSEFMEMLVGMWAAKVRELFNKAKTAGKAIIFIDEIDAIGKKRGAGHTGGHQEQEQTLNQILTEMDGFDKNVNIVVLAATNRPDTLDPALMRAGRFDRKVMVGAPTYDERILIFNYYFGGKQLTDDINIESLAKRTSGLVGADIENIVNEAALKVAKDNRMKLGAGDMEYALEKVLMWPEKKVASMTEEEKRIIALHELGHAVTLHLLDHTDPVEKISVVRRGHALGATWTIPQEDKYLQSKAKFLDELVGLLGGRAAEEVFFWEMAITTWASNDLEKATAIVHSMLLKYGMDKDLGPVLYADDDQEMYFPTKPYSEKTAELIDQKLKSYLNDAYVRAKQLVESYREDISKMADLLIEKEYFTKDEFVHLMQDIAYVEVLWKELQAHKEALLQQVNVTASSEIVETPSENKKKSWWLPEILDKFLP